MQKTVPPYSYSHITVATTSAMTLIPNFSEKIDTRSLVDANVCSAAINGGFYDTAAKPLGFFFANNRTFGQETHSTLLNGFFWSGTDGIARISTELTGIPFRFALQTGPLLFWGGKPVPLAIRNDERARRMVVAKSADNHIMFFAVYNGDSVYDGPLLGDLPGIIFDIRTKENLEITEAVNLDGGSASAFYNADTRLSELTPVGSLFCVK